MATKERQVNININYKVNTVEVEKSSQLLNRASQATDNLNKTTQSFSNNAAAAYKRTGTSIGAMQIDLARLKTQIEVTAKADTARLKHLSDQYKKLNAEIKTQTDLYLKQSKVTADMSSNIGQVITAAKGLIAVGLTKEILDWSLEMSRLAGNVEGVERAFNKNFNNPRQLLADLKEATHGTVTEFELMQRTLQATNLGVAVEKLPVLFEFAAARAQQTGESVDYLVDSIVRGIGRKSILILDNLGLSATRLKEQFNGASLASQSVADVTLAVGRIAEEELTKMGGYAETAATRVDRLTASIEELKVALAENNERNGNILLGIQEFYVEGLTKLLKGEEKLADERAKAASAAQVDAIMRSKEFKEAEGNQSRQIDLLLQEIIERKRLIRLREAEIEANTKAKKALISDLTNFNIGDEVEAFDQRIKGQKESKAELEDSVKILAKYLVQLRTVKVNEDEILGIIEKKRKEIEAINEEIEQTNKMSDLGASGGLILKLQKAQKELDDLLGKSKEKKKKDSDDIAAYLSYIGQLEFFQMQEYLKQEGEIRRNAADREKESEKNSYEHWLYYHNLRKKKEEEDEAEKDWMAEQRAIFRKRRDQEIYQNLEKLGYATLDFLLARNEDEVNQLQAYYDRKLTLAGDNERARKEIEIQRDRDIEKAKAKEKQREKREAKIRISTDGIVAIAKTFSQFGWPAGIIPASIMAGITALQLATVNKYKDGVIDLKGPGTATSDSIPARLSRGESVMTAKETLSSKGIFKAIRAKKLNDRMLQEIVSGRSGGAISQPLDLTPVVKELRELKNSQPSFEEQGPLLFKTYAVSRDLKRRVKAKSMHV